MNTFRLRGQRGGCGGSETMRSAARAWRERGQSMVLVALMLVAFIGFLAMVIDLGNVYAQRRFMQSAADAGALAGVQQLALHHDATAVDAAASEYACTLNGAESYGLQILSDGVVVSAATTAKLFFAPVLGIDDIVVGAVAEAGYEAAGTTEPGNLVPVAVASDVIASLIARGCVNDPSLACQVAIWDDDTVDTDLDAGIIADGQRGWVNFNGGSVNATELGNWVRNGYTESEIRAGNWYNGTPGGNTSALQDFSTRLTKVVYVPVYDKTQKNLTNDLGVGSLDYHIVAFAAFEVDSVQDIAHPKGLYGKFVYWVTNGAPCTDCESYGSSVIGLR